MAETTVTVVATKRDALDPYIKIIQSRPNDIDVSFSSYLKPDNKNEQQKEQEDTELSIFEARSYFSESGGNDGSQTRNLSGPRFSSVSTAKVSSFTVGHTASSEASWNSQTGLLSNNNRQRSDQDGRGRRRSKKGTRWFFRRRTCPCSSSKSVQVQETKPRIAEPRTGSDRTLSNRIAHNNHKSISSSDPNRLTIPSLSSFSFPTLNEPTQTIEKHKSPVPNRIEPGLHPVKPVLSLTTPKGVITDEEAGSDDSSDLFEIESFSTQHVARPCAPHAPDLVRNSIDDTATEYGYEPSEASVTWSVTTAEPASTMATNFSRISLSQSPLASSGCDKRRACLLGCRCEKAVMVSGGQRLVQPLKRVRFQDDVAQKVLCNNGSSKLSIKSSFLI
ncbi:hypothetical protein Bca4012_024711 [Brassica carinata]|uniref:Uncharacterized protein n=1 Tax=Brassica carinata TaxID=52824 RepID=A0A8X8ATL2_BRACI|nr:hypothetical protein Bca52824_021769 [Brassica carinata]